MKTCKIEGCMNRVWAKNLCLIHTPKKPLKSKKKSIKKISAKGELKKQQKKEYTEKQFELFKEIYTKTWKKTCYECECFVDGKSSANFHHLLYKGVDKYKKYALEEWNIILICLNCHQKTHTNIDLTPRIKQRTLELKEIYG